MQFFSFTRRGDMCILPRSHIDTDAHEIIDEVNPMSDVAGIDRAGMMPEFRCAVIMQRQEVDAAETSAKGLECRGYECAAKR